MADNTINQWNDIYISKERFRLWVSELVEQLSSVGVQLDNKMVVKFDKMMINLDSEMVVNRKRDDSKVGL